MELVEERLEEGRLEINLEFMFLNVDFIRSLK